MRQLLSLVVFCTVLGPVVVTAQEPVSPVILSNTSPEAAPTADPASDPAAEPAVAPVTDTPSAEVDPVAEEPVAEEPAFDKPNLVGSAVAVVPGLLLHGAGHWAAGDRSTGYTLLATQLGGAAAAIGGISILALTGANTLFTPAGALLMMYGSGGFGGSFIADLYGVAAPRGGFGSPVTRAPWVDTRVGYRLAYDRIFVDRTHAATAGVRYRVGEFGFDGSAAVIAPSGDAEAGLDLRYRLYGPQPDRAAPDGSYSDLVVGYDFRSWSRGQFDTHTVDLYWDNRWDLVRLAPSLDGLFMVYGAGLGLQTFVWDDLPSYFTTLLLSRMGVGLDLGEARDGWGELLLFYDHRHDGPTGGFKMSGLGSGTAGHFGLEWGQHIWNGWGLFAQTTIGSAWVNSIGVERRFGGER